MHLTADEERTLAGEEGLGRQRAMELLVALGDIYGAERLVRIASAQVSGASYKTIGDAGISWLEDMAHEARASVRATVNPLGMDLRRWRSMGIDPRFQAKQVRITAAYLAMGLEPLYSCTPYLSGNRPRRGQHLAWAESSATVFANSYLGAKTNREGGPSALAAAIIGKTAMYGLHLDENRVPKVRIVFDEIGPGYVPLAGYLAGKIAGNRVPEIQCDRLTADEHKSFGAALAATGAVSMYVQHQRGDDRNASQGCIEEVVEVDAKELSRCAEDLSGDDDWDLAGVGCPHCSPRELTRMAAILRDKKPRKDCEVWFCTSRGVYAQCPEAVRTLKRFGKVLCDTCIVVSPIEDMFRKTVTDSGKAMVYLPTLGRQRASFRTTDQLLEAISR